MLIESSGINQDEVVAISLAIYGVIKQGRSLTDFKDESE
jgi:hypothetical protein